MVEEKIESRLREVVTNWSRFKRRCVGSEAAKELVVLEEGVDALTHCSPAMLM
jgi:hypothetical protein